MFATGSQVELPPAGGTVWSGLLPGGLEAAIRDSGIFVLRAAFAVRLGMFASAAEATSAGCFGASNPKIVAAVPFRRGTEQTLAAVILELNGRTLEQDIRRRVGALPGLVIGGFEALLSLGAFATSLPPAMPIVALDAIGNIDGAQSTIYAEANRGKLVIHYSCVRTQDDPIKQESCWSAGCGILVLSPIGP